MAVEQEPEEHRQTEAPQGLHWQYVEQAADQRLMEKCFAAVGQADGEAVGHDGGGAAPEKLGADGGDDRRHTDVNDQEAIEQAGEDAGDQCRSKAQRSGLRGFEDLREDQPADGHDRRKGKVDFARGDAEGQREGEQGGKRNDREE